MKAWFVMGQCPACFDENKTDWVIMVLLTDHWHPKKKAYKALIAKLRSICKQQSCN